MPYKSVSKGSPHSGSCDMGFSTASYHSSVFCTYILVVLSYPGLPFVLFAVPGKEVISLAE
jgi:hypothetical protein